MGAMVKIVRIRGGGDEKSSEDLERATRAETTGNGDIRNPEGHAQL